MFRSNRANLILSLVLAIVLWFYVAGQVDPRTDKDISGVVIEYINTDSLQDNGLDFAGSSDEKVVVELEGKRAALNRISESDIKVTADLSTCTKGKNVVTLKATSPKKVDIEKITPQTITVIVEERVNQAKSVNVKFDGDAPEGKEPGGVSCYPENVGVWGAESTVERVKAIEAEVDVNDIKDDYTTVNTKPIPVDKDGNKVENVWLSANGIEVTAVMMSTKKAKLDVKVEGGVSPSMQLGGIDIPDSVTIKGSPSSLANIKSVRADSIDIQSMEKTENVPINVVLPYGVELAEKSQNIEAKIIVKELAKASFDFSASEIAIKGKENKNVTIHSGNIVATVTGTDDQIEKIAKDDVKLSVSLGELKPGRHNVQVDKNVSKKIRKAVVKPDSVDVEIRKEK